MPSNSIRNGMLQAGARWDEETGDAGKATGQAGISTSFERLIRIVFPRDTKARPGRYGPDSMAPRPRPAPAREA